MLVGNGGTYKKIHVEHTKLPLAYGGRLENYQQANPLRLLQSHCYFTLITTPGDA